MIQNYKIIFQDTEDLRERQRTERASAKHGRRLRSLQTSKSLSSQGSVRENRPINPTALALKAEYHIAAPQDIGPPPLDDIPPPPPPIKSPVEKAPDIGPPTDEPPPPLMVPVSPRRSSAASVASNGDIPSPPGVLPGFSPSLDPPPPVLSPLLADEDIPPPPDDGGKNPVISGSVLLGDSGKAERKHRRKTSSSGSGSVSADQEKKKKKHHHKDKEKTGSLKSSKSSSRDRGESVADVVSESKKETVIEEGSRARAVSDWAGEQDKSSSAGGVSGCASDTISQGSEIHTSSKATPRDDGASPSPGDVPEEEVVTPVPEEQAP